MKIYRVTVSLNISSAHKLVYRVAAHNIAHAERNTRHWDRVRIELVR